MHAKMKSARNSLLAALVVLAHAALGAPSAAKCGDDRVVECANVTDAELPDEERACPGSPVACSGRGRCSLGECHCDAGFFGKDCAHTKHDCVHLRSCGDCNNAANTRFCGWCADGRYCVPNHVHKALLRKGGACQEWHEDSCPRRAPRNGSAAAGGADEDDGEDDDERGDDRSVAFAEALVAMIDERAGKGTSVWLLLAGSVAALACVARCALHEQRAADRRLRYEAYMAEEAELRAPVAATRGSNHSPFAPTPGSRRLGDAPLYDTLATDRLAAALGSGDGGGGDDGGGGADAAAAAAAADAVSPEAAATLTAASVREAARRDHEERKQLKREQAALARKQAERAARDEREERARAKLVAKTQQALDDARREAAAAPAADAAPPAAAAPAGDAPPPSQSAEQAESEFMRALDEL